MTVGKFICEMPRLFFIFTKMPFSSFENMHSMFKYEVLFSWLLRTCVVLFFFLSLMFDYCVESFSFSFFNGFIKLHKVHMWPFFSFLHLIPCKTCDVLFIPFFKALWRLHVMPPFFFPCYTTCDQIYKACLLLPFWRLTL